MTLPDALASLRDEASRTSCESWAIQNRWTLSKGRDRSGPCPKCGGSDRFSINTLKDVFNCRQCGISGQGVIKLVMLANDLEFVPACELITGRKVAEPIDYEKWERDRQLAEQRQREQAERSARERERARKGGYEIWESGAKPGFGGAVDTYLKLRALDFTSHPMIRSLHDLQLREHDYLPYAHPFKDEQTGKTVYRTIHTGPAMLAAITMANGRFGAVHRTWLDAAQPKGKVVLPIQGTVKDAPPAKKMLGTKSGGAIRLYTPRETSSWKRIVMGEGIETTLTACCHAFEHNTAYWAGADVNHMAGKALRDLNGKQVHDQPDMDDLDCFIAPDWCEELVYLGEADEPGKHQREKCIRGLRRSLRHREMARQSDPTLPPLKIIYVPPPSDGGSDLNDIAMADAGALGRGETIRDDEGA